MEIFHAQRWFEFPYLVSANLFCGQHVWIPRYFSFVNLISASPFLAFLYTCWLPGVGFLLLCPSVKNLFTKYTKMQTTPEWDLASPCSGNGITPEHTFQLLLSLSTRNWKSKGTLTSTWNPSGKMATKIIFISILILHREVESNFRVVHRNSIGLVNRNPWL